MNNQNNLNEANIKSYNQRREDFLVNGWIHHFIEDPEEFKSNNIQMGENKNAKGKDGKT